MLPETSFWLPDARLIVVSTHAVAVAVAVGVGLWWAGRGGGPAMRLVALAAAVFGLVGARAAFVGLGGGRHDVVWSGGFVSMGGVWAGLAAACATARALRVPVARALDRIVPAGLLGLGIGRIGCFLGGCCYGRETTLPWAVVFPDAGAVPRHPLQLYSAVVDVALVATVGRAGGPPGRRARHTLTAFALARIALDALRDPATADAVGPMTAAQLACMALLAAMGIAALRQRTYVEND